jgi:hypothetical protein
LVVGGILFDSHVVHFSSKTKEDESYVINLELKAKNQLYVLYLDEIT